MDLANTGNSHIQLIVPEGYLQGGFVPVDHDTELFDGDVDSQVTLVTDTNYVWNFESNLALHKWTLLFWHYGNTGTYKIRQDDYTDLSITDFAEEDIGQTSNSWDISTPVVEFARNGASEKRSNLLLEHTDVTSSSYVDWLDVTLGHAGSNLRQVIFSRDYKVPMYNRNHTASYGFQSRVGNSFVGTRSPRFSLRESYVMAGNHSFEWTDLTAAEQLTFELFIRAFGGNMMRPFAMCVMHGTSPVANNVMSTMMLLIDSQSVKWKRDRESLRHGISFSATELIPN